MQRRRVGRDRNRRRGVLTTGTTLLGPVLGLVLTLSGCGPFTAEQTSAAPSSTVPGVQAPSEVSTDPVDPVDPVDPATGPIPTVTAEPLSPTTPTAVSPTPVAPTTSAPTTSAPTTSAPTTLAPTSAPTTVVPVTAAPIPTRTGSPGTAAGSCARTLTAYPVLEPGAEGAAVRTLQCFLNDDGYGPVAVDGVYGTETRAAVRRVEASLEGPPPHPGRIDAGMWVLVISRSLGNTTLQLGSTGPAVVTLQRALRAAGARVQVDGRFGTRTKKAVQRLQDANRVGADGIVRDETLFLLKSGATIG